MRILIAAALFTVLVGCGQSEQASPPAPAATSDVPAEWQAQLTASPMVARTYGASEVIVMNNKATATDNAGAAHIVTSPGLGAFSAVLNLGAEAEAPGPKALRVRVHVETGSLQLVMTYNNFPPGYAPFNTYVTAGQDATLYLPVDANPSPVLVVANGVAEGQSIGELSNIELVTAP